MLCDAVQGFGRMAIPEGPDLVALSGHKIHGPKGIGGLWMRAGAEPAPLLHGGGQELGLRSGTLSPALCVGFGEAARLAVERREADAAHVDKLRELALATLGHGWIINGSVEHRYPGNLNLRREGARRRAADLRPAQHRFLARIGVRQRVGAAEPCVPGHRPRGPRRRARRSASVSAATRRGRVGSACRRIDEAARAQEDLAA